MTAPVRILVVEDERIVATDIQRTLERLGYVVPQTADSGDLAIALTDQLRPDLVLMDIRLRGPMDGIIAASVIRNRWDIPVIYLTAHADSATLQRAKISEPFGYVLKPFEERDLHTTIEMALYKHQLDRRLRESQQWLSVTLSSIGDGVIATDPQGHIVFINPVAEALTGWKAEDAKGQPLTDVFCIVNEKTRERVENPVAKVLATGLIVGLANHTVLIAQNGTERPIDDSGAPIQAPGGELQGVVLVFRDITDRRKAEADVEQSERKFRTLTSHAPVGIFQTDTEGNCLFVNQRWCEIAGMSVDQAVGTRWVQALHPDDRERISRQWYEAAQSGHEFIEEFRFRSPQGRLTWLSGRATALRTESGEVIGYIGTITDITEHRQMTNALKEADRRKDEFLATLAHELRNPLAPIRSSLAILKSFETADAHVIASRDIIDRQVQHMARLLDDLLDVSRITRNRLDLRKEPVLLSTIIEAAVETSRPLIDAKGHRLSVSLPSASICLDADPVRLAQVFSNLLNNAAKYTEPGGVIELSAERRENEVIVAIKDNGIGIPKDVLPRIFDIFSQAMPAIDRSESGLGIGLSLVKGLVELHGGSIVARSNGVRQGSEFTVRLPALPDVSPCQKNTGTAVTGRSAVVKRRLLIVDDLRDSADSLAKLLQLMGHDVATAYSGEQALQIAEAMHPDVVLLDLGMPKLNGYDVCSRIREQPWGQGILIIALTGWGQEEDRRRTEQAGFNGHLVKPVEIETLSEMLASCDSAR